MTDPLSKSELKTLLCNVLDRMAAELQAQAEATGTVGSATTRDESKRTRISGPSPTVRGRRVESRKMSTASKGANRGATKS